MAFPVSKRLKRAYIEIKSSSKMNEATSLLCITAGVSEVILASA